MQTLPVAAHQFLNSIFTNDNYIVDRNEINYIVDRNKMLKKMKYRFKKSTTELQRMIKHLQDVINIEGKKEIKKLIEQELKNEVKDKIFKKDDEIADFIRFEKEQNAAEWKNKYIQLFLKRKYSDDFYVFAQSVMFVGNYNEALGIMQALCDQVLDLLEKLEIKNLERDAALINLILTVHEMYMFLTVQPMRYYDSERDLLDFMQLDDLNSTQDEQDQEG